jgi:hypothetical protein
LSISCIDLLLTLTRATETAIGRAAMLILTSGCILFGAAGATSAATRTRRRARPAQSVSCLPARSDSNSIAATGLPAAAGGLNRITATTTAASSTGLFNSIRSGNGHRFIS